MSLYSIRCFLLQPEEIFLHRFQSLARGQFVPLCDVIMGRMASQITSLSIVYSIVHSGANQRKHQSPASLAFVRGIHPAQIASNAENVSIWLRNHAVFLHDDYNDVPRSKLVNRKCPRWLVAMMTSRPSSVLVKSRFQPGTSKYIHIFHHLSTLIRLR